MDHKKRKIVFKIAITFILLVYLHFTVNYTYIFEALGRIKITLYALATCIAILTSMIIGTKYYYLIKNSVIHQNYLNMIKINLISRFYGMILPTSLGRGVARWYKVTQNKQGRLFFFESTIIERMTQYLTLLFLGLFSFFIGSSNSEIVEIRSNPWVMASVFFFVSINVAGILFFFNPAFNQFVKTILRKFLSLFINQQKLAEIFDKYTIAKRPLSLLLTLFLLSLIWQIAFICRMYLLFQALSIPLHLYDVAWMSCLVLLLQMIPITFAGLGLREGAYAYLVTIFDINAEYGVIIGLLFFTQMLFIGVIGWWLEVSGSSSRQMAQQ